MDEHGSNIFPQFPSKASNSNKRQMNEIIKPHVCTFCQKKFARYI